MDLEAKLRGLLNGEFSSLTISFNEMNAPNYTTVEQWLEKEPADGPFSGDWISTEEREKAIATNSWWNVQWYPDTPIGSYEASASSLTALLAYLFPDDIDDALAAQRLEDQP